MIRLTGFGCCAFAAVAWLGCTEELLTSAAEQAANTGPTTPGGQTPYLSPSEAGLPYYEYLPPGYDPGAQYPLIVFFHGIGECGDGSPTQLAKVLRNGPPKLIEDGKDFPAIVISPQAPITNPSTGACSWLSRSGPFVDYILNHYPVDRTRIYITGLSLGGQGTWGYAKTHASSVAAIVPVCGPRNSGAYDVLRGVPTWAFHRDGDQVVPISDSASILQEITLADPRPLVPGSTAYFDGTSWTWRTGQAAPGPGENPAFTVYPRFATGDSHNAWTAAYNNQAMWDWLFQQRRIPVAPPPTVVFTQDFQSSTSVSAYVGNPPGSGQVDDISSEVTGGTWSVTGGRLQLARTGSTTTDDNDAGITRWTNLAAAPTVLHVTFDLGVSDWTTATSQTGAMVFAIGAVSAFREYGSGEVAADTFYTFGVKGGGAGQFAVTGSGTQSALLPTNGAMHRVTVFLNGSVNPATYRAPDGSLRSLQSNGAALWVDGAAVIADGPAPHGASSTLTDFRIRWTSADDATWMLDNLVIRTGFPS